MVSVVVSHLIGTISLLIIFSIVGTYCGIYFSLLQPEVIESSLQEVSEYCSAEIVDLATICSQSAENQMLFIKLEVPESINENAYTLTTAHTESIYEVVAQLISSPSVFGETLLPWSVGGNMAVFNGTDPGINDPRVNPKTSVSSLSANLIIWCLKKDGRMTIGLGEMEA